MAQKKKAEVESFSLFFQMMMLYCIAQIYTDSKKPTNKGNEQTNQKKRKRIPQKDGHKPQTKTGNTIERANKHALHINNQGSFKNSLFDELICFLISRSFNVVKGSI